MDSVTGTSSTDHRVRCLRWNEIDYGAEVAHGDAHDPMQMGDKVLEVDNMQ